MKVKVQGWVVTVHLCTNNVLKFTLIFQKLMKKYAKLLDEVQTSKNEQGNALQ